MLRDVDVDSVCVIDVVLTQPCSVILSVFIVSSDTLTRIITSITKMIRHLIVLIDIIDMFICIFTVF